MSVEIPQRLEGAKVLIVDDEASNVRLLTQILRTAGYQNIASTTNPMDALKLFIEYRPDIVLLDLKMPRIDGFQILEQIKEYEETDIVPVLVLTAHGDRDYLIKALEMGAVDFLSKPYDRMEVLARIKNIVSLRLLLKKEKRLAESLNEKVRDRTEELRDIQLEIVRRLGRATEYKDEETGLHVVRMSWYSTRLYEAYGASEEEAQIMLNASPMHDIGKIGVPDKILLKPGKLDEDEWKIMKTHTTIGAKLLSGSRFTLLQAAEEIAISHHEKWDGSGYPNGLKGEEIPIMGRICCLCDVFDAMTSKRPYKEAKPLKEGVAEIKRQRGSHFDPDLVGLFLDIVPTIYEIHGMFKEPGGKK